MTRREVLNKINQEYWAKYIEALEDAKRGIESNSYNDGAMALWRARIMLYHCAKTKMPHTLAELRKGGKANV